MRVDKAGGRASFGACRQTQARRLRPDAQALIQGRSAGRASAVSSATSLRLRLTCAKAASSAAIHFRPGEVARLVLADEPIASLDPESSRNVMEILARINREDGCTVLVSLHQVAGDVQHRAGVAVDQLDLQLPDRQAAVASGNQPQIQRDFHAPGRGGAVRVHAQLCAHALHVRSVKLNQAQVRAMGVLVWLPAQIAHQ